MKLYRALLRDLFAAKALHALLVSMPDRHDEPPQEIYECRVRSIPALSYKIANSMLSERELQSPPRR